MTKFFVFGTLLALAPLAARALTLNSLQVATPITLVDLIGRGELALLAAALSARGIGEAIRPRTEIGNGHIAVIGADVLLLIMSAVYYGSIAGSGLSRLSEVDPRAVTYYSQYLYGSAVFVGAVSVFVGQRSDTMRARLGR